MIDRELEKSGTRGCDLGSVSGIGVSGIGVYFILHRIDPRL